MLRYKKMGIIPLLYKLKYRFLKNDEEILNLCSRLGSYDYLKRYESAIGTYSSKDMQAPEHVLWTCWLQGEDHAPLLVQRCWQSMRENLDGYKLIVLTETNLNNYIDIPPYILYKHTIGIIPHAHFADIIRVLLLITYGGIWIDSTILLLNTIPTYVTSKSLFCFKYNAGGHIEMANSFLASHKNHPILLSMRDLLFAYWNQENKLVSYSLFHLLWSITINHCYAYQQLWNDIPYYPSHIEVMLWKELNNSYSEVRLNEIREICSIQKLTYKFEEYHIDTHTVGTFYDVLINQSPVLS